MFTLFLYKSENVHNNVRFVEINSIERERERDSYVGTYLTLFFPTLRYHLILHYILF